MSQLTKEQQARIRMAWGVTLEEIALESKVRAAEDEVSKPAPPDWQQLYALYCGMAMQGLLSSGAAKWEASCQRVAEVSQEFAAVLVHKLRRAWDDDKGFDL